MSKANFDAVVRLVAGYVGEAKASGLVERRLTSAKISVDRFTFADLTPTMRSLILGAAKLYIPEKNKQDEFEKKLNAMAPA